MPFFNEYRTGDYLIMKNLHWFRRLSSHKRTERTPSLGGQSKPVSWSKYLVSSGGEIRGEGEYEWSADMCQLLIGNKFAVGRYSRVYHGKYKGMDVAIKMVHQPEEDLHLADFLEEQFNSEVAILFHLRHPNIVTFVAACKKPPVFCIITEYMGGGTLRDYIHQQDPHSVPLTLVLKLAVEIARGMQYLHSQGILHRDLKPENLLLTEDMNVKIADFGISCLETQCVSGRGSFTGTYRWMAPEMIKNKHHTKKVDVYSYGIILWEILTATTPFPDMSPEQAAFAVSHKNVRPPLPTACPVALSHLISRCWSANPDKRPHFHQIVLMLECYMDSLHRDPSFLSSYKPSQNLVFSRCIPRCMSLHHSSILKA